MRSDDKGKFDTYNDRGMKKWAGFYLSEHTAMIEKLKQTEQNPSPQKKQLSAEDINLTLQEALMKNLIVAIQTEEVNFNGDYAPDIIGKIQGHDELGIYLDGHKIDYDEIRHVTLHDFKKWSALP